MYNFFWEQAPLSKQQILPTYTDRKKFPSISQINKAHRKEPTNVTYKKCLTVLQRCIITKNIKYFNIILNIKNIKYIIYKIL